MKIKIIMFILMGFLILIPLNTNAAQYENIGANDQWGHNILGDTVGQAAVQYINQNGINVEGLRNEVNQVIANAGGWDGIPINPNDPRYNNLARIDGEYIVVGCGNADLARIYIGGNNGTSEPVITSSSSTSYGGACSSYISNYIPNWSVCNIEGNWNSSGSINCKQINSWSPVVSSCGNTVCITETIMTNGVVSSSNTSCSCDSGSCPGDTTKPADVTETISVNMSLASPITNNSNATANNNDTNDININISGITNDNKAIVGLPTTISEIKDLSGLKTNRIENIGDNALNFENVSTSGIIGTGNSFYFNINGIKSYAPLKSNNSSISFKANGVDMILSGVNYHFEKPFIGEIKIWDNIGENWDGKIDIGTSNKFKIVSKENKIIPETEFKINNFISNINAINNKLSINNKSLDENTLNEKDGVIFYATINTSESATELTLPGITINVPPIINYVFGGKNISYYLNSESEGDNNIALTNINGKDFIGVKVIGNLQGDGKQTITGQENNFSSVSKLENRTQIRKNAYEYINNMISGEKLNGVYYYSGNKKLSEINLSDIETIVIKDGNLIIDKDINNNIGIIVIKDGYNVENGYMGNGNVYVTPNVKYIKSTIYSDGGLISIKEDGSLYFEDNFERSNELKNQLIMEGSLFTKNTIGGAIIAGGNYILPGDKKVIGNKENFFKAMTYDLNYIRRANKGCDKSLPLNENCNDNGEYKEAFIIKYDSNIQINPPKLFKIEENKK